MPEKPARIICDAERMPTAQAGNRPAGGARRQPGWLVRWLSFFGLRPRIADIAANR
ncbi:hypothetical protein IC762_22260 [Bradyrhizobium genosp. L]|uniref:hypothetical protein n=1 Tax=Bradyrhizobium genosp. L TaxID=83637 RepID=UPI0018A26F8D|nr:hypothetical protein [Bradyrhizobium genosp. L]QPF82475.1 hypothetical protein IC762_22260 [Bradyrhizobium genosp. L]